MTNRFDATQGVGRHDRERHDEVGHERLLRHRFRASSAATASTRTTSSRTGVLPYSNQQVSATLGGPIMRDRAHFFVQLRGRARAAHDHLFQPVSRRSTSTSSRRTGRPRASPGSTPSSRRRPISTRAAPEVLLRSAVRRHRRRDQPPVDGAPRAPLQRPAVLDVHAGARATAPSTRSRAASPSTTTRATRTSRGRAAASLTRPVDCGGSVTISFRGYSIGSAVGQHQYQDNYSIRDDSRQSFAQARASRREDGRRVHQPADDHRLVRPVHGRHRGQRRADPGQHRGAVPGLERRLDLESGGALADHRARPAGGLEHRLPLRGAAAPVRRLAAGRLEGVGRAHAEPWRALRRPDRRPLGEGRAAAVARRRPAARPRTTSRRGSGSPTASTTGRSCAAATDCSSRRSRPTRRTNRRSTP